MAARLSPFGIRSMRTHDHTEAESVVNGVQPLQVDRLTSGPAAAEFVQLELGDVSVVAGNYGGPIHSRGEVRSDQALIGLQMAACPGHWNGRSFRQDAAWIYGPGAEHDGVGLEPTYFAAVGVPAPLAEALSGDVVPERQLQLSLGSQAESLRDVITDLVDLATTTAARSGHPEAQIAGPARAALIDGLAVVLGLGHHPPLLERGAAARVVSYCMQAADHLGPQPSPLDLSAATGLTDRRIRAAFNERVGVPVATYFRYRALHAAHRELTQAQPGQTTVATIATRWGFWHLGRFAQRYRDQFGVPPSTTLNAAPEKSRSALVSLQGGTYPQVHPEAEHGEGLGQALTQAGRRPGVGLGSAPRCSIPDGEYPDASGDFRGQGSPPSGPGSATACPSAGRCQRPRS